ncbi:MAG: dethiobiotin synthase [Nitriliruptorales bacterium]|nr:dethiobiotin synthase [Nitriliruptorales bacterium]
MRGVLITGTDTGVGKTFVAALVCRAHPSATYVKPVQTGLADAEADAAVVARIAGVQARQGPGFDEALAPAVAAERAARTVTRAQLLGAFSGLDEVVGEGAGGLLVELGTDGTTLADLAADLNLPLVVVARPGLGTLNHTRLTCEAAWARGLRVAGIVVNGFPDVPDVAEETNLNGLAAFAPLLAVVPRHEPGAALPAVPDLVAAAAS